MMYRAWKKAEKLAMYGSGGRPLRYTTHHHAGRVMRINGRTGVIETIHDPYSSDSSSTRPLNPTRPIFGPSCCCCGPPSAISIAGGGGRLASDSCPQGYFHPTPRGKLPFGAASSVHTFLPPRPPPHGLVTDEDDEDDSLSPSVIEHGNSSGHDTHHSGNECTCDPVYVDPCRTKVKGGVLSRSQVANNLGPSSQPIHQTSRKQSSSNSNWLQSSVIVDELHRKHANMIGGGGNNHRQRTERIGGGGGREGQHHHLPSSSFANNNNATTANHHQRGGGGGYRSHRGQQQQCRTGENGSRTGL